MVVKEIPVDKIIVTKNVRTEPERELGGLMESIERFDIIQPVLVVVRAGGYELVSGHRRLAAVKARNEPTIPAVIRDDLSARDISYVKLLENVQRKGMSAPELVQAFEAMKAANPRLSMTAIGKMLGKTETWVADQYRIAETRDDLLAGGLTEDEIRHLTKRDILVLSRVTDPEARVAAAQATRPRDKQAARAAAKAQKRGAFVDRSGGFALMGAPGCNTVRVMCENADVRKQVIACLLRLKARRTAK